LFLDQNAISGKGLQLILEGCNYQSGFFRSLVIQDSEINEGCADKISELAARPVPEQLDRLELYFCKVQHGPISKIIQSIVVASQLKSLALVKVPMAIEALQGLVAFIPKARRLTHLDLSWNSLPPKSVKPLLEVITESRRLQFVDLSWTCLVRNEAAEEEQQQTSAMLGSLIKFNKQLLHLNLEQTGLTELVLRDLGHQIRRAGSVLSIHLSGNPGLSKEVKDFLVQRIRIKPYEDVGVYTRISTHVAKLLDRVGLRDGPLKGIQKRMDR
jgi:hypothetical protein